MQSPRSEEVIVVATKWEPVVATLAVILIIYFHLSTSIFILGPWMFNDTTRLKFGSPLGCWIFLTASTFLIVMSLWSFLMSCLSDPGYVSHEDDRMFVDGGWCKKCERPRPARAHHCSSCSKCVKRMDHHCPWISKCVGWSNQGHFLRFLFYTSIASIVEFSMIARRAYQLLVIADSSYVNGISQGSTVILVINFLFLFWVALLVTILFLHQLHNCLKNTTDIEWLERDAAAQAAKRQRRQPPIFPFDIGFIGNLELILGKRKWAWLIPLQSSWQLAGLGGGNEYEKSDPSLTWPPTFSSVEQKEANDDHSLPENRFSKSDSTLLLDGSQCYRFRRGSEGFLVPSNLISRQMP